MTPQPAVDPRPRRSWLALVRLLTLAVALPALTCASQAQIPGFPSLTGDSKNSPAEPVKPTPEALALEKAREAEREDAAKILRDRLAEAVPVGVPDGVASDEVGAARRAVDQFILAAESERRAAQDLADARQQHAEAKAALREWSGFTQKPPYSMLLVEELREYAAGLNTRIAALEAGKAYFVRESARFQNDIKTASAAFRQAQELASSAAPERAAIANWRVEMAQWAVRGATTSAIMAQRMLEATQEQVESSKVQLRLIEVKLGVATKDFRFTTADLEQLRADLRERQEALQKERDAARHRAVQASNARSAATRALESLRAKPSTPARLIAVAEARLRAADAAVETARFDNDVLDTSDRILRTLPDVWKLRLDALTSDSAANRRDAVVRLRDLVDRVRTGRVYATSQLDIIRTAERDQALHLARTDPESALLPYETAVLDALRQRGIAAQRLHDATDQTERTLKRWLTEAATEQGDLPWTERVADTWAAVAMFGRSVWNFELFDVEETIDAEGKKVTVSRGVTVGKSIGALLIFVVGYFLGARVTRRIERILVARSVIGQAPARTIRRWVLTLLGFLLLILTLNLAKIPLTVFAFLGGALAIGVGFGTQTIIKNFISGMILLMERQVRVGDIVEADGVTGTVTEVNLRSSTILGFDGVEAIVPNSTLLEQRVTNWTHSDRKLRRVVRVGVAYGSQVTDVAAIMKECADRHGLVMKSPEPYVLFEDFGDSALLLGLYFWIEMKSGVNGNVIMSDLRFMFEKRFEAAGIVVAYPQREVHLQADRPLQVEVRRARETPAADAG